MALKFSDPNCDVDQAYVDALQRFADRLAKAGATVREAEPEVDTPRLNEVYFMLLRAAMSPGITDEEIEGWRRDMETPEGQKNLRMLQLPRRGQCHAPFALADPGTANAAISVAPSTLSSRTGTFCWRRSRQVRPSRTIRKASAGSGD